MTRARTLGLLAAVALRAGCGGDAPSCRVGADCASGVCLGSGTCAPPTEAGPGGDGSPNPDGAMDGLGAPDGGADRPDGASPSCTPNGDGILSRDELPLAAGQHATFRIAHDAGVATAGMPDPAGGLRWDLSIALAGDRDVRVETASPAGAWYAADFPGATYATQLADGQDLLGIFELAPDALLLRGVVSPASGALRTELTYMPPVPVLALPMRQGSSWTTTATVTGVASGVPVAYTERYDSTVDAHGSLVTPYATFPVLRVRVLLTRTVGLTLTTVRSFVFAAECFGEVAGVTSHEDEPAQDFTAAAEVRRLAP